MLIECLIPRDGSTCVTVAGFSYEFQPRADGRSVCDVMSPDHQEWFLSLPQLYRAYEADADVDVETTTVPRRGRPRKAD